MRKKKSNKNSKIALVSIILAVVIILSVLQLSGIINIFGVSTESFFPVHIRDYELEKGEEWMKGVGHEVMPFERYVVAWQQGENSQAITARADFQFDPVYGADHLRNAPFERYPGQWLGYYWMTASYKTLEGAIIPVIDSRNDWHATDYIEMVRKPPDTDYAGDGKGYYFPYPAKTQYKTFSYMEPPARGKEWWLGGGPNFCPGSQPQCENSWYAMSTHTYEFKMKGNLVGELTVLFFVEGACVEIVTNPFWDDIWHTTTNLICTDGAELASGEGEVIITSVNAVGNAGSAVTEETNIVYTKYVYEEGLQVEMAVDAGYSGSSIPPGEPGYNEGWTLEIFDSTGKSRYSVPIDDNVRGYPVYYTIPDDAWIPNDPKDNEWRVVLMNTLFDQSETRLFVVDEFANMPGQPDIDSDKNRYVQFETVYLTIRALSNENTENPIDHFQVWAKYDSEHSTDYALLPTDYPASLIGGRIYGASPSFQLKKGNKFVYVRAHAIDTEGRAGPEKIISIWSEQATGNYQVTVTVTDDNGNPLSGATATMGGSSATSDSQGIANLYVSYGMHTLTVSKSGYRSFSQAGIQVQSDMNIPVTLTGVGEGNGLDAGTILLIIGAIIAIAGALGGVLFYMKYKRMKPRKKKGKTKR